VLKSNLPQGEARRGKFIFAEKKHGESVTPMFFLQHPQNSE
jgi:hypothetical protein